MSNPSGEGMSQAMSRTKTILLVHDGHGPLRGSEGVLFTLLDHGDPSAWRFVVLTNHPEFAEACRDRGIEVHQRDMRTLFLNRTYLADIRDLHRQVRIVV